MRVIRTLSNHSFKIAAVYWDRGNATKPITTQEHYNAVPVISRVSGRSLLSFLIGMILFSGVAILKALTSAVDIIHCHDMSTVPVGLFVKLFKRRVKVVYHAHDHFPSMVEAKVPSVLKKVLAWVDSVFARKADYVIVPSPERKLLYSTAQQICVIRNVPEFTSPPIVDKGKEFSIFYGGQLSEDTGIHHLIKAVEGVPGIRLIFAGRGPLAGTLRKLSEGMQNLWYLGVIPHEDAIRELAACHATFVFYRPTSLNRVFAAPSKMFEAMFVGVPIIANKEIRPAQIIEKHHCGILVPFGDIAAIKRAILLLKSDKVLRQKLGENGRQVFLSRYAWNYGEEVLMKAYRLLRGST
jgi:glycosyltransferase involved in cell wall biosynthesis